MSSLKLPQVLSSRRSNIYEAERDEFEKSQAQAVLKAINTQDGPAKEKHVRTCILGTHREKGAGTYWSNVHKLQLESHPLLTWKFCHVLHKLMREGHSHVISDSMKYRSKLADLGKLWSHLKDGYGPLIKCYCKLLLTKLEFHSKNPQVPGNMQLSDQQLQAVGENDINNWYCLVLDMMDYMDDILALQHAVFSSLDMSRANSMTRTGQCRLAPLILCILDSSCLYDYMVKMMFKLHAHLPADTLSDHRVRFSNQFKPLKQFYYSSSNLQYFKYLISVPCLPDNPPNFLSQSAFADYVPQHARMLNESSDFGSDSPPDGRSIAGDVGALVDISEPATSRTSQLLSDSPSRKFDDAFGSPNMGTFNFQNGVDEKDQRISSLQHDLDDAKATVQKLQAQFGAASGQLQKRVSELEHELRAAKELVEQMSEENERYREQAEMFQNEKNQLTVARLEESEKKAQSSEEKFKKMKDVYAKLREEHIEALKRLKQAQQDVEEARKAANDDSSEKERVEALLAELRRQCSLADEKLVQSSSDSEKSRQQMTAELDVLRSELDRTKTDAAQERAKLSTEIDNLTQQRDYLHTQLQQCNHVLWEILNATAVECERNVTETVAEFENPAHLGVTCSPEFMLCRTGPLLEELQALCDAIAHADGQVKPALMAHLCSFSHVLCEVVLHGKATANAAPVDMTERLIDECRLTASATTTLFNQIRQKESWAAALPTQLNSVRGAIEQLETSLRGLLGKMGDIKADELGSLIEKEMKMMDAAIAQAAEKIQAMMAKRKETDSGVKLEVNEKILDTCNTLMLAVLELVRRARDLQAEIVAQGRGTGSAHEFYARNHQWTEGLLSAAKAIGVGAHVLMESADRVVNGTGKFEELVVASQEIAASTAQLVMASKVKADKSSERLSKLGQASRSVTTATATVVGTVKAGQETLSDQDSLDFSKLSLNQAKRLEMESKVRVLELESTLQRERQRLAELRKKHYELAGPAEGWDEEDSGGQ